jgi:transcriptional regulator with XRE-family HTH domain
MTISRKPDERDKQRGRELAQRRRDAGLTQEQLALMLSVSVRQYGKYERGETRMSSNLYDAARKILLPAGAPAGLAESGATYQAAPMTTKEVSKRVIQRAQHDLALVMEIISRTQTELAVALRNLSD